MTITTPNLSTYAKQLRSGAKIEPAPVDYLQTKVSSKEEFLDVWLDKGKLERFGIEAIIADQIIERAISNREERAPYGLITLGQDLGHSLIVSEIPSEKPFEKLKGYFNHTLEYESAEEETFLKNLPDSNLLNRRYKRLVDFASFYNNYNIFIHPEGSIKMKSFEEIDGGSKNGIRWMTDVLEYIPITYKEEIGPVENPDDMTQIARNSFPLVTDLGMMHGYDFFGFISMVSKWKFKSRNIYTLDDSNGNLRLDFVEEFKENIPNIAFQNYEKMGDKLGCPGMVNFFDDGSPIRKIWDWYVDIAVSAYKTLHTAGKL